MASNSSSLDRCLVSLGNTVRSPTTGRPLLAAFIEKTSGSNRDDHLAILAFLVGCLEILSDEPLSEEDKKRKAIELASAEGSRDPPRIALNPELLRRMLEPADLEDLKHAVHTVFDLNVKDSSKLGNLFDKFAKDERAKKTECCAKKKSRTCQTI